ncbi:MAG: hypothetical protein Q8Q62_22050 [Mesorhizobium sp.]|nr:hypothetical protein [Mesorhizobium sp.]
MGGSVNCPAEMPRPVGVQALACRLLRATALSADQRARIILPLQMFTQQFQDALAIQFGRNGAEHMAYRDHRARELPCRTRRCSMRACMFFLAASGSIWPHPSQSAVPARLSGRLPDS